MRCWENEASRSFVGGLGAERAVTHPTGSAAMVSASVPQHSGLGLRREFLELLAGGFGTLQLTVPHGSRTIVSYHPLSRGLSPCTHPPEFFPSKC